MEAENSDISQCEQIKPVAFCTTCCVLDNTSTATVFTLRGYETKSWCVLCDYVRRLFDNGVTSSRGLRFKKKKKNIIFPTSCSLVVSSLTAESLNCFTCNQTLLGTCFLIAPVNCTETQNRCFTAVAGEMNAFILFAYVKTMNKN